MAWVTNNYCNGCPDCIGCGRNKNVQQYECNGGCETILYEDDKIYEFDGEYYCSECAWEYIEDNLKDEGLEQYRGYIPYE